MQKFILKNENDLNSIVDFVNSKRKKNATVLLFGNLGSGKTTFVRYFAKQFNIDNVASPSFNIIHNYKNDKIKILHVDLYRINKQKYVEELNLFELFEENNISFIEWPELIEELLIDYKTIKIYFNILENKEREVIVRC